MTSSRGRARAIGRGAALALAAAVLVGAGCGGDGGEGTSTTASDKAEFVRRADALCADIRRRIAPLRAEFQTVRGQGPNRLVILGPGILRRLAIATERQLGRLASLRRPADAAGFEAYLANVRQQIALTRTLADAIQTRDANEINVLNRQLPAASERGHRLARAYGLRTCGGA